MNSVEKASIISGLFLCSTLRGHFSTLFYITGYQIIVHFTAREPSEYAETNDFYETHTYPFIVFAVGIAATFGVPIAVQFSFNK